jgi:hypothetical protein
MRCAQAALGEADLETFQGGEVVFLLEKIEAELLGGGHHEDVCYCSRCTQRFLRTKSFRSSQGAERRTALRSVRTNGPTDCRCSMW